MRILIILLAFLSILSAELPPQVYQEWKNSADIVGIIKIVDTNITIKDNIESIIAKAQILKVIKSKENVETNITIKYKKTHKQDPLIVGPSPVLTLQKGKKYNAYLNKKESIAFLKRCSNLYI